MAVRYLFNTSGEYVAFGQNSNIFTPDAEWLGVIRNGNEFYLSDGSFAGYVLDDDRVVRRKNERSRPRMPRPLRPLSPIRPFPPLRRLRMPSLPYPYEDFFEKGVQGTSPTGPSDIEGLTSLEGAELFAADNTYLGRVTRNTFDANSLANEFGPYGNPFNPGSIFNQFGTYGNPFSTLSPFNEFTRTPPRLMKGNQLVAYVSENTFVSPRIEPHALLAWLGRAA